MIKRVEKGQRGYIAWQKFFQFSMTLGLAIISLGLFIFGYISNDFSNANIFTILSMLMVLPAAKYLVSLIVLFPYKSSQIQQYEDINKLIKGGVTRYADVVMTSKEKVMNFDFILIGDKRVIGLMGKKKQDLTYMEEYLKKGIQNYGVGYQVEIYQDFTKFKENVAELVPLQEDKVTKDVVAYIRSLMM